MNIVLGGDASVKTSYCVHCSCGKHLLSIEHDTPRDSSGEVSCYCGRRWFVRVWARDGVISAVSVEERP